jgi:hypothetical protein
MLAIIVAMLPVSYHFLIGVPFGIWALIVLRRPAVQAAFARKLRQSRLAATPPVASPVERRPPGMVASFLNRVRSVMFNTAAAPPSRPSWPPVPESVPVAAPRRLPGRSRWWLVVPLVLLGLAPFMLYAILGTRLAASGGPGEAPATPAPLPPVAPVHR